MCIKEAYYQITPKKIIGGGEENIQSAIRKILRKKIIKWVKTKNKKETKRKLNSTTILEMLG